MTYISIHSTTKKPVVSELFNKKKKRCKFYGSEINERLNIIRKTCIVFLRGKGRHAPLKTSYPFYVTYDVSTPVEH